MVQFTERQMRRLKRKAALDRVSFSELVRRSVERALPETKEETEDEKWRRATAALGKFRSGRRDIAAHHDKYFSQSAAARRGRRK